MEYRNCNEELSIKLVGRLTLLLDSLENDLNLQIKAKEVIDECLYDYEVTTKCTALSTGDIKEKASIYIACKKLEGLSNKTLNNYSLFLNKLDIFFNKPCSTINTMDLRMFLSVYGKGKQQSTLNNYITYLKNFFGWLKNEEYIVKNPAAKLHPTKVPKVILQGYKAENLEKLRDACITTREKCLFELIESTACRISELVDIKISNINFDDNSIKVTGKGNKQRIVYFSTRAKIYINKYLEERNVENEYLFVATKGKHEKIGTRSAQKIIKKLQQRAGVEERVHAHKFRRTQATHLLNSGMTLQGVQKLLGHESPETTQRYAQISQENLKNEYKRLVS